MTTFLIILAIVLIVLGFIVFYRHNKKSEIEVKSNTLLSSGNDQYVDLGLSVKWASCNVGANSPEEFGTYFNFNEAIEIKGLPSNEQWRELQSKCKFKYNKKTKVIVVTGPNGNTISFPMACDRDGLYDKSQPGAYFWSAKSASEKFEKFAYFFFFVKKSKYSDTISPNFNLLDKNRCYISVRTVN